MARPSPSIWTKTAAVMGRIVFGSGASAGELAVAVPPHDSDLERPGRSTGAWCPQHGRARASGGAVEKAEAEAISSDKMTLRICLPVQGWRPSAAAGEHRAPDLRGAPPKDDRRPA